MRIFLEREVREAQEYAEAGGQALHLHQIIVNRSTAPRCFVREVDAGNDIAHLFDQNLGRLRDTVRELGVRVVVVERRGEPGQHVDLCAGPLQKAIGWARKLHPPGQEGETMSYDPDSLSTEMACLVSSAAASKTGRLVALDLSEGGMWSVCDADQAPMQSCVRVATAHPGDNAMGVMKRIATARQLGIKIPQSVRDWSANTVQPTPANTAEESPGSTESDSPDHGRGKQAEPAADAPTPKPGFLF
ncbi:MAG: hypothetical protein KGR26_12955 [Cyanobacteria bacterium REEB65]|nr:hypothetical protein [Cyanobacteria bacterium REEB65]